MSDKATPINDKAAKTELAIETTGKTKTQPKTTTPKKSPQIQTSTTDKTVTEAKKKVAPKVAKRVKIEDIKPKKVKMVSDSFTMPKDEYALLAACKDKCLKAGVRIKKSELVRAGLIYLSRLPEVELIAAVAQVEQIKPAKQSAAPKA